MLTHFECLASGYAGMLPKDNECGDTGVGKSYESWTHKEIKSCIEVYTTKGMTAAMCSTGRSYSSIQGQMDKQGARRYVKNRTDYHTEDGTPCRLMDIKKLYPLRSDSAIKHGFNNYNKIYLFKWLAGELCGYKYEDSKLLGIR